MTAARIYLLSAFIISIVTYLFWGMFLEVFGVKIFYIGIALSFFLISLSILKYDRNVLSQLFVAAAVNNLTDEILFDPTKVQINEFLIFGATALYLLWQWKRK